MIAVPLIYFSILLLIIIRKHGFDASASMTSLYVLTSFFAVLVKIFDVTPLSDIEIKWIPTFFYCFLISLTIYPFYRFNTNKIQDIKLPNSKLFNIIVYIYFTSFIVSLIFNISYLREIITTGNFGELRNEMYKGGLENGMSNLSGILKYILMPFSIISISSYVMLMFYFYSITFLNKSKLFNIIIFVSSLSVVVQGILTIDRSKIFYYLLFLYLVIVIFKRFIHKKQRRAIRSVLFIAVSLMLVYFVAVTISRFGKSDMGSGYAFLAYAGQPFIYFCEFWDKLNIPKKSFQMIFPFFSEYIIGNSQGRDWINYIDANSGLPADVFFSSIGMFVRDVGKLLAVLFTFTFSGLSIAFIRPVRGGTISFGRLLIFFLFAIIPQAGIMSYFYNRSYKTMSLIFLLFISSFFKFKRKRIIEYTNDF